MQLLPNNARVCIYSLLKLVHHCTVLKPNKAVLKRIRSCLNCYCSFRKITVTFFRYGLLHQPYNRNQTSKLLNDSKCWWHPLENLLGQLFSILLLDKNFPLEHTGLLSFCSPSELGTLFTTLIRFLGRRRGGILKMLKHSPALWYKTLSLSFGLQIRCQQQSDFRMLYIFPPEA